MTALTEYQIAPIPNNSKTPQKQPHCKPIYNQRIPRQGQRQVQGRVKYCPDLLKLRSTYWKYYFLAQIVSVPLLYKKHTPNPLVKRHNAILKPISFRIIDLLLLVPSVSSLYKETCPYFLWKFGKLKS